MTGLWSVATRSLNYHRRSNLAIGLGVAAAAAVLTGALIVGDSMRGSLRDLTLDRLGKIDSIITGQGFFRESLSDGLIRSEAFQNSFESATPVIFFQNGSAQSGSERTPRSIGQVTVFGIRNGFWDLGDSRVSQSAVPDRGQVVINQVVADDLGINAEAVEAETARITVGIPGQDLLPSDSSLGDKGNTGQRLVDLRVTGIVSPVSLGRFDLQPSQIPPRIIWVSMSELQSALSDDLLKLKEQPAQANMILIGREPDSPATDTQHRALLDQLQPNVQDLGLSVRHVRQSFDDQTVFEYFSVSSDRLVIPNPVAGSIRTAFPESTESFVYLANNIRNPDLPEGENTGIPFSIIAAVDFPDSFVWKSGDGNSIHPPNDNEIVITSWAARDQDLQPGGRVTVSWFDPETTHGQETEQDAEFIVSGIAALTTPTQPFRIDRRRGVIPAVFDQRPTVANDPDFTPEVPGLTDAESIERWDLPFATADRIRPQDDEYWDFFRTTPKAYVSLATGRRLWASRFGQTTSFRIPVSARTAVDIERTLINQLRRDGFPDGFRLVPVRRDGLHAASGATPFDALFLGLSLFIITAALVLVSLMFRLALQRRSQEMGTMLAFGFQKRRVARLWLIEMLLVCLIGALAGTIIGIGYASLMLLGLRTWWLGAISTPFLSMHIKAWTLPLGLVCGVIVCVMTILVTVRSASRRSVRDLLAGDLESPGGDQRRRFGKLDGPVFYVCLSGAIGLALLAALNLGGEARAGAFMTAGFLILIALLVRIWRFLGRKQTHRATTELTLHRLAMMGAARNPLRSTLTIGVVAVASFLILAISAFRLAPTSQGTAGFNYVAQTSQPVFENLNTTEGQNQLLRGQTQQLDESSRVFSLRFKSGQNASCNNLYQSTQPRVLGISSSLIRHFDDPTSERFAFSMTPGGDNPWHLLEQETDDGTVPVIIDKNTAWYSLKIYVPGTRFTVNYDSGESVTFRLVGLLSNSVLQGSLLISESRFTEQFPDVSGYRYFLMKLLEGTPENTELDRLSAALSDYGFDSRRADSLLAGFLTVQNTYLNTFQSLGLLGLFLGTFGLAAVQLRTVLERRRELGLLQAVGFTRARLAKMIAAENVWLLTAGLATGIVAALVTTLPHYFLGEASVPWLMLLVMFGLITVVGLASSWLASRSVFQAPLLESLRAG